MNQPNIHRGTIVPMVTPFTKELALDEQAAKSMVDRLARYGLGAFVLGTTGEGNSIPNEMRNRLVEIAVDASDSRVPVYAGVGGNCVLNSVEAANDYLAIGADAVVAALPAYYALTESEMLQYFELLSDQINGALVPYNIPQTTHMSIPIEVVKRFADWPNVVGFKDSENTPGRLQEVSKLGNRSDFSIFMGVARNSVEAMQHGYDGLVPSSGNLIPNQWKSFSELVENSQWDEAREMQCHLDRIAQTFQGERTLGQSLATLKTCMAALDQCQHYVLPPLETRPDHEIAACKAKLENVTQLQPAASPAPQAPNER